MSTTPSTVGPSASIAGAPLQERRPTFPIQHYGDDHKTPTRGIGTQGPRTMEPRRVHYEDDTPRCSPPKVETKLTCNQDTRTPSTPSITTVTPSSSVSPTQEPSVTADGGGPMMGTTTHQKESMDITASGNN